MRHLLAKTPLRLILVLPFVAQISAAVGLTAWLSIRNGQQAVDNVANELWSEITARTEQHITEYTQIPQKVIADTIANQQLNLVDLRDPDTLGRYLWHQMSSHEGLFITAVGYETGEVVGVGVDLDGQLVMRAMAAGQTQLQTYAVLGQGDRGQFMRADDFDLKSRPWYQQAVEAGQLTWTGIYPNYAPPFNILSAASPIYDGDTDQLIGVTNATLSLWQISDFLETLEVGRSGEIFIIERSGNLVATSTGEPLNQSAEAAEGNIRKRLNALESGNARVQQTAEHLRVQFGDLSQIQQVEQTEYLVEGDREIVQVTPFSDGLGLDWLIVITVPESDFMAQINANTRNTIWLCLAALAVATGSSIITARWITQPLLRLNQAAKQFTQGSLQSAQPLVAIASSRTREMSELSHSFTQMTRQLQASFAAVQQSEATKQEVLDAIPDLLIWMRADGTCEGVATSDQVTDLIPSGMAAGQNQYDALPPDIAELRRQAIANVMHTGQVQQYEQVIDLDGTTQYEEVRVVPLGADRVLVIIRNISDLKEAEIKLQGLTKRWELAAQSARMGIWEWDIVSDRLIWDDLMFEIYGVDPADFSESYTAWETIIHPDDFAAATQAVQQALADIRDLNTEFRVVWPDGTVHHIEAHAMVLRDAEGNPRRMIGVNWDISERKQAEADLRNSMKDLADIEFSLDQSSILAITDAQGVMTHVNDQFCEISQYAREEVIGQTYRLVNSGHHPTDFFRQLWQTISTGQVWKGEIKNRAQDGSLYWVDTTIVPFIDQAKKPYQYVAISYDITERKQAALQLQDLTERLGLAVQAADMGIWEWDMGHDHLHWDEQMFALYNLRPAEFANVYAAWQARVHPEDLPAIHAMEQKALAGEQDYEVEFRIIWPDGSIHYIASYALVQRDADGTPQRMVGANLDISDRKQAEAQLIYNALHDALTDLPNRTLLTSRLESALQRVHRSSDYHFAVLFLDLDRFKVINDSLGHLVGDQLLLRVAQNLQKLIRPTDVAARLGGDEFVILLEHIPDIQAVIHMAERLRAEFNSATVIEGHSVFVTTSIGIVWGSPAYTNTTDLLRDADIALYRAKAQGRGGYEIFDAEMHVQALKRMTLEHDLRIAIAQQAFIPYYQPIVDLNTQRLVGFEALIRWPHPTRGLISPADFIPIAEETGLILSMSQWMLQSACEQIATWQRQFPNLPALRVSVNLSGHDLRQPNLVEAVLQALRQAQLSANALTLEITESMLIENIEATIDLLGQLRDLGVRISIDDFGTGYSSLSYLYNLPADYLKIDQSFVSNMQPGDKHYKIVQAIVSLSDQLQLTAIAEGIETPQQLAWLKALGCELGQGYLLARPLPSAEAAELLSSGAIAPSD